MSCGDCGGRGIGFGPAVPVAILCNESETYTSTVLCNPSTGEPVIAVVSIDSGGLPTTTYFDGNGDPYTGPTPVRCDTDINYVSYRFCVNGEDRTRTDAYIGVPPSPTTTPSVTWWTDVQGNIVAAPGGADTVEAGACGPCDSLPPTQFCFSSSDTATQDLPGRSYTGTLSLALGFGVTAILVDNVANPVNVLWETTDQDGTVFSATLAAAIGNLLPAGANVTITPSIALDECSVTPSDFDIVIDCIAIDDGAPADLDLRFNAGQDLITNPAFNLTPPVVLSDGLLLTERADAGGRVNCTNIANEGWYTNDPAGQFEVWGPALSASFDVQPTPRGTLVQEVNANGINTLWQTFTVATGGLFTIEATVGGRSITENFRLVLSTGDDDDNLTGDIFDVSQAAPNVLNQSNPWTQIIQNQFLVAGTYTLALVGPPTAPSLGGLYTDLRVFTNAPNQVSELTTADNCTVSRAVTTETSICEFWQPILDPITCDTVAEWRNAETGETLTNAEFWSQVPSPECCTSSDGSGDTEVTAGNLAVTMPVCGVVVGTQRSLQRILILNQSGGIVDEAFQDSDGVPVAPDSWSPEYCAESIEAITDGLCELVSETASIDWSQVDGTITVTNPTIPTGGDVKQYVVYWGGGDPSTVIGNGPTSNDYGDAADVPQFIPLVISGGDFTISLTLNTLEPAGTVSITRAVSIPLQRDSATGTFYRCLTGEAYTPTTLIKCDQFIPPDVPSDCCPVAGDEVVVGSGFGFDMISGQSGTWTPATNQIVAAFEISVKTIGDVGNPPIFTDSRGISTPITVPTDLAGGAAEDWGAPSFTNIPTISYSVGDVLCVAWTYAETEIV